jgi:hypothetical protein
MSSILLRARTSADGTGHKTRVDLQFQPNMQSPVTNLPKHAKSAGKGKGHRDKKQRHATKHIPYLDCPTRHSMAIPAKSSKKVIACNSVLRAAHRWKLAGTVRQGAVVLLKSAVVASMTNWSGVFAAVSVSKGGTHSRAQTQSR